MTLEWVSCTPKLSKQIH